LIPKRNSGLDCRWKDPSLHLNINQWTSGGKTIVPWCSGVNNFLVIFYFQVKKNCLRLCIFSILIVTISWLLLFLGGLVGYI